MAYIPYNPYEIFLYDYTRNRIAMLQGWKRLEYTQRLNAAWNYALYFDMSEEDDRVSVLRSILPDYFVLIYRLDPITFNRDKVFEGVNLTVVDQALKKGSLEFTLYGQGYTTFLKRRVTIPPAGYEADVKTDTAEACLKSYINDHFMFPADPDRTFMGPMVYDAITGIGDNVTYSGRYTSMETVCQSIAADGGVTYGITSTDPPANFKFEVRRIWGLDRRINSTAGNPPMFFNLKLDNMEIPILSNNYSDEVNVVYVGGQGSGTARTILELENTDATAVSPLGRKEAFADARGESDNAGLLTSGKAYIQENKARKTLTFNVRQSPGSYWLRNWGLGDIVTAKYYNFIQEKKISEVKVSVSSGKDADVIELIEAELEDLNEQEFNYIATYTTSYNDADPFTETGPQPPYFLEGGTDSIAAFDKAGNLYLTDDFTTPSGSGGPTWTQAALTLNGTPVGFVGDAFSPLYAGTGTTVNGWLLTSTDIYYISNVKNIGGTRSVTSQFTFATETIYRTIQTDRGTQNWVMVASYYTDAGVTSCYTTDGSTWTEVTVSADTFTGSIFGGTYDWIHSYDFTTSAHGWIVSSGTQNANGIDTTIVRYASGPEVYKNWNGIGASTLKWAKWEFSTWPSGNLSVVGNIWIQINNSGSAWGDISYIGQSSFEHNFNNNLTAIGNIRTRTGQYNGAGVNGHNILTKFHIAGTGADPYPGDPGGDTITGDPTIPVIHVSGKTPGLAYIGAISGGVSMLYKTTTYGATWAAVITPATDFGAYLGGSILFPWNDNNPENLCYWGNLGTTLSAYRTEANGLTTTEITPTGDYGPNEVRCWGDCALNHNFIAFMGTNYATAELAGFYSSDAGDTWTNFLAAATRASTYTALHITDDETLMYFWGPLGVGYSADSGGTIDDRRGNMSSPGEIISIIGV